MELVNNITDTALIFEGGGMRASYTAGFLNNLLENEIYFDYVAGISAGSSHSVNYLSRDIDRSRRSFVDLVLDPQFGGWRSFLRGEGFFRAEYIYELTPYPDAALPFDTATFMANPARLRVGAFNRDTGEMKYYSKSDMRTLNDLMKIVRSSSSMPIFMPPTYYGGNYYVDGGLGGGIPLDIAQKDGLKKFFVVLTQPRGYRKKPMRFDGAVRAFYRKHPCVYEAMRSRWQRYNNILDELEQMEREGKACLVFPEVMPVSNRETDYRKLTASYERGYAQGRREVAKWKEFLGLG